MLLLNLKPDSNFLSIFLHYSLGTQSGEVGIHRLIGGRLPATSEGCPPPRWWAACQQSNDVFPLFVSRLTRAFILGIYSFFFQEAPDVYNQAVATAIRRDVFETVLKSTHFVDNARIDESDKFAKVRPLFNQINKASRHFPDCPNYAVDEAIIRSGFFPGT